jgi:endoglucanase
MTPFTAFRDGGKRKRIIMVAVLSTALAAGLASGGAPGARAAVAATAGRTATARPAATAGPAQAAQAPDAGIVFPAHTSGSSIVDADGHSFRLNCVNWYGAETSNFVPMGLNLQSASTIISEIVDLGFNCVRLPWSNQMWETDPSISGNTITANPQFAGQSSKTIFEEIVRDLADAGLMVILDDHNSNAEVCCSSTDGNTLWYNSTYTQADWVADWKSMVATFDDIPQVIGVDLRNEPRGGPTAATTATWGGSSATNWQAAAELGGDAVQSVDPNMLIFVEGVNYALDLSGVESDPVVLTDPDHVVYEAHDYGFDFSSVSDYDNFVSQISDASDHDYWAPLVGKVPLWIGEFGCNGTTSSGESTCSDDNGNLGPWFGPMIRFLDYHNLSWSYWAINGTTATGVQEQYGILNPQWDAIDNFYQTVALSVIQGRCTSAPLVNGRYYITNVNSGDVIDDPGFSTTEGTDLDQWPLNGGANQQWSLQSLGCGLYEITNVYSGQSMDISGQDPSSGGAVDQWDYWGGGNQQFVIADDADADGAYNVSAVNSMTDTTEDAPYPTPIPIEVPRASDTAGTKLDQETLDGGTNQEWTFTCISGACADQ